MIEVSRPFLAPGVMFSAGGLLCPRFARFTAVVGQVRAFGTAAAMHRWHCGE